MKRLFGVAAVVLAAAALGAQSTTYWTPMLVPAWDDVTFPASGIDPLGSANDPTRSTTTGLLQFSGSADNVIGGIAQMPHGWVAGTDVYQHVHLRFPISATCNTRWKLELDAASVNGDFTNNSGVYTDGGTITVANPANVKRHVVAGWSAISMTGKGISTNIAWRISRLASSDAADDCAAAVELMDVDIHHQVDSLGSRQEYVK